MKTISNEFKTKIAQMGRQIDFKIDLFLNDKLITQDNKFILTQDEMPLVVEQFNEEEVDETLSGDSIFNVIVSNKGNLFSTMMKEIDFEIREDLRVGEMLDCSFGLKINKYYETEDETYQDNKDYYSYVDDKYTLLIKGTDYNVGDNIVGTIYNFQEFEWVNFGKYIIYSKEYNEDTSTFSYIAYDSMLFTMITLDNRTLVENVTVKTAIDNICNKVGLTSGITADDETNLPNLSKVIALDTFKDIDMTYRDVLNQICQCLGVSIIVDGKTLKLKYIDSTIVDEFDENYLKDINVTFGELYGPVNSLVLSRSEDNDNLYRKDDESIAEHGLHEYKIKDNLIMLHDDREDYIDEIFNQIKGLEYYVNDFSSTGITYLEWLDMYKITRGNKEYKCLMLNDEIKITQGLEEYIYTEQPDEAVSDYKIAGKTDKEVSFIVDKQKGEISSKVSNGEIISSINQSAEQIQINADKISLAGKDIDLTTDNISIYATNFTLDADGNLQCANARVIGYIKATDGEFTGKVTSNSGSIGGWTLNSDGLKNNQGFYIKNTGVSNVYTMSDILIMRLILAGVVTPQSGTTEFEHYDLNNDGVIDSRDLLLLRQLLLAT